VWLEIQAHKKLAMVALVQLHLFLVHPLLMLAVVVVQQMDQLLYKVLAVLAVVVLE
jgi:hypothetical protein